MSASLVGSEMCIRDRPIASRSCHNPAWHLTRNIVNHCTGRVRVDCFRWLCACNRTCASRDNRHARVHARTRTRSHAAHAHMRTGEQQQQ
eukprot:8416760-Alexandrium_andersonii.AAC.1